MFASSLSDVTDIVSDAFSATTPLLCCFNTLQEDRLWQLFVYSGNVQANSARSTVRHAGTVSARYIPLMFFGGLRAMHANRVTPSRSGTASELHLPLAHEKHHSARKLRVSFCKLCQLWVSRVVTTIKWWVSRAVTAKWWVNRAVSTKLNGESAVLLLLN